MNYVVKWTFLAEDSYFEEIEFIYLKWNHKEVLKFEKLVVDELNRLAQNPTIGKLKSHNYYELVISKQTTLYYKIDNDTKSIELHLFWNNLKNPEDLKKFL